MTEGFFIELPESDVVANFANGGRLVRETVLLTYQRDEAISFALDPELAVRGVEGDGRASGVWKGV